MSYFRTAILLAAMTALFMGIGFLVGGQGGMIVALLVAMAMNLFAYWNSDKMVLSMYGAEPVDETTAPEFHRLVSDLAARAGLPKPRIYIIENPQPNTNAITMPCCPPIRKPAARNSPVMAASSRPVRM